MPISRVHMENSSGISRPPFPHVLSILRLEGNACAWLHVSIVALLPEGFVSWLKINEVRRFPQKFYGLLHVTKTKTNTGKTHKHVYHNYNLSMQKKHAFFLSKPSPPKRIARSYYVKFLVHFVIFQSGLVSAPLNSSVAEGMPEGVAGIHNARIPRSAVGPAAPN